MAERVGNNVIVRDKRHGREHVLVVPVKDCQQDQGSPKTI